MNCLPPDLLFEVLACLPPKDLLTLRVVCKLWNSIICDRSFHQHNLHQLRKNNIHGCEYYLSSSGSGHINAVDIRSIETFATIETIKLCESHYDGAMTYVIRGCVDGVLLACTASHHGDNCVNVMLWNPTLKKIVDIPLFGSLKYSYWNVEFGFGFDSVSYICKVVALYLEKNNLEINVYNLGTRSWTSDQVKRGSIDNLIISLSQSLNFEGCIYWLAMAEIDVDNETLYVCFNLSTEALTCSKLPDAIRFKCDDGQLNYTLRSLAVLCDSLALVDEFRDSRSTHIRVWIRRKDSTNTPVTHIRVWIRRKDSTNTPVFSWVELYNIDCHANKSFLYLSNNGDLYLEWRSRPVTVSVYDLKARIEKICLGTSYRRINFVYGYLPSLALLR